MTEQETALSVSTTIREAPNILADLRGTLMTLSTNQMTLALTEFEDRRNHFRKWLLSQLVMGVHYGVPPGCEPKEGVDPRQWKAKPSLYKSGADFLVELMGWRPVFENDVTTWEMLGKPNTLCLICRLFNGNHQEVGEGRGGRARGEKKMADNATIKLAKKCALVDAVISALNLSDLFTQDMEDKQPTKHENPEVDPFAPKQQPRDQRIRPDDITRLSNDWKLNNPGKGFAEWSSFVQQTSSADFNPAKPDKWTRNAFMAVQMAVAKQTNLRCSLENLRATWISNNEGCGDPEWSDFVARATGDDFEIGQMVLWSADRVAAVRDAVNYEIQGDIPY